MNACLCVDGLYELKVTEFNGDPGLIEVTLQIANNQPNLN